MRSLILSIREEPVTKPDRLLKEAIGWSTDTPPQEENKLTKLIWEDKKVMLMQLMDEEQGPVWRQTQGPERRRPSQLLMPIPTGGMRAEEGLVIKGVAARRDGKNIAKNYVVVGRIEIGSPWVAEGMIEEICSGEKCFVVGVRQLTRQE